MRIDGHIEKFRRFDALRERFDPVDEFELWYWMGLSAGTAIINAALHASGITEEDDGFATQVANVYAVMDPGGGWHHELRFGRDLIHVGLPPIERPLPETMQKVFDAMDVIERYRDPCTRGLQIVTSATVADCESAYRVIVDSSLNVLHQHRRVAV